MRLFLWKLLFKAAGVRSEPRVDLIFGLNDTKSLSLTFSQVEKNQFGVEDAENIRCKLFYEPDEGSRIRVVEIDRLPAGLLSFKELSHDLAVGPTIWNQSTLAFTSPMDFSPSASDKVLMLQDASGLPLGVFEQGVKEGPGGIRILRPLVIRKIPNCFSAPVPSSSEPKKTIHGFETPPK